MVLIAPIAAPEEGLVYTNNNVKLKIGDKVIGNGILYIVHNSLAWQPEDRPDGISISWKQISVHGVSNTPTKSIYFMLDHQFTWRGVYDGAAGQAIPNGGRNGGGDPMDGVNRGAAQQEDADEGNETDEEDEGVAEDDDDEEQMTECWLLPSDLNTVDVIFQAMTECQALHPDSADSISEESDFMDDDGHVGNGGGDFHDSDDDDMGPNRNEASGGGGAAAAGAAAAQGGMQNLNLNDNQNGDADSAE